ncbi:MAG: hypothetical protein NT080_00340 [Spirochaetes bacterium]|nr:hypothetical protein [Spirochaetota bacterium]
MRIDDIAADIVARNAAYVAALSTVGYPLVAITAAMLFTREFRDPTGKVSLFLEPQPEEMEEIGPGYRIATLPVDLTVFTMGYTEAVLREQARNYAQALLNCLMFNPYFFTLRSRDDFEGVEGKADIKATKLVLEFKYEETP